MTDEPGDMSPEEAAFGHVGNRQNVVDSDSDDDTRSFDDVQAEVTGGESGFTESMTDSATIRHDGNRVIINESLAITLWLNTDYDEGLKPTEHEWLDEGALALTEPTTGDSVELLVQEVDEAKHTTGTIDGHSFTVRVDGDAPEALVVRIESALAQAKAEVEK